MFPKEAIFAVAALLASLLPSAARIPRWLWIGVSGGAILLIGATVQSHAPLAQLVGRWPRYEGLITLSVYVMALWFGSHLLGATAGADRILIFRRAVSVASIVLAAVSIAEAFGLEPIQTTASRSGALLGNATDQGVVGVMFFAVLAVPVARHWAFPDAPQARGSGKKDARNKGTPLPGLRPWLALAGTASALVTVVISASRAAFLSLMLIIVALIALELVRRRILTNNGLRELSRSTARDKRTRAGLVGGIALASIGFVLLAFPLITLRLFGLTPLSGRTISDRGMIYRAALDVGWRHPLTGVGPSGFVDAVPSFLGSNWYGTVGPNVTLDSPHNWILQALVAGGIPLAVLALALAVGVAMVGILRWTRAVGVGSDLDRSRPDHLAGAGLAILGFGVALMTDFTSPGTTVFAALLIGSLVSATPRAAAGALLRRGDPLWRQFGRMVRTIAFGGIAVLLIIAAAAEIPLQRGADSAAAHDVTQARSQFDTALALRPWDSDAASIAGQLMAQQAEQQVPGAADAATVFATRSLMATPGSIQAAKALAVGQQYSGHLADARATLTALKRKVPLDSGVVLRLGGVDVLLGNYPSAETELLQATRLSPKDPAPWEALAYLYGRTGDLSAAAAATAQSKKLTLQVR